MAIAQARFKSEFQDEPRVIGDTRKYPNWYVGHHDIHTGTFVLARCFGDAKGTDVYRFDELDRDKASAIRKLGNLVTPENVYAHLLPWMETPEIPTHLDTGEPGVLTIFHRPAIIVDGFRIPH